MTITIDPVTFAVIKNAMDAIVDEVAYTVLRTARSEIVKDVMDYSAAICDRRGRMIAQAKTIRSEEHTSELQSLMRISYAVFCLKKKKKHKKIVNTTIKH